MIHHLPKLYRNLLPANLQSLQLRETTATCEACIQAKAESVPHYRADLKCCTFNPFIPNFLVGGILKEGRADARSRINKIIDDHQYALPLGLCAPPEYQSRYARAGTQAFGQREDLLCPHFNRHENNCGIWEFRPSACSTFFCQSSYGKLGDQYWRELGEYLHQLELALAQEYMLERGFHWDEVLQSLPFIKYESESTALDSRTFAKLWCHHHIKPLRFYIDAYDWVISLNSNQIHGLTLSLSGKRAIFAAEKLDGYCRKTECHN